MNRQLFLIIAVCGFVFLVGVVPFSRERPIDGDEGYYLAAARLVSEGQAPYTDFFYPQMPLAPYLFAAGGRLTGWSLVDLRLVSVAAAAAGLLCWGLLLGARVGRRPALVVLGLALVVLNPHFLSWSVTLKTYALANLGVLATLWALDRGLHGGRPLWPTVAGLSVGLAVGVRALYLPWAVAVLAAYVVMAARRQGTRSALIGAGAMILGFTAALLPAIFAYVADPDLFMFNNLSYHQLRFSPFSADDGWARPMAAVTMLARTWFTHPGMLLLLLAAGWGTWRLWRRPQDPLRTAGLLSGVGWLAYTAGCLLPNPVYEQYFTATASPLLAPLALAGITGLLAKLGESRRVVAAGVALLFLLTGFGLGVRRVGMSDEAFWTFNHLARVTEAIERNSVPGDTVLSLWSGYAAESGRRFVPGMENHFALGVSEKLNLKQQLRYHIAGKERLLQVFTRQNAAVVVLGAWNHEVNSTIEQAHLTLLLSELDRNYEIARSLGNVSIMVPRETPLPADPSVP